MRLLKINLFLLEPRSRIILRNSKNILYEIYLVFSFQDPLFQVPIIMQKKSLIPYDIAMLPSELSCECVNLVWSFSN